MNLTSLVDNACAASSKTCHDGSRDLIMDSLDRAMKKPANQKLELTNTDAAQSVLRPLCLLSAFAAQFHVRLVGRA
jgi:hypothetical protein